MPDGQKAGVYDAENRLISASNGTSLTYDPMGRLWQVVKGVANTRFLYDGDALVAEYDGVGAMTARYVHGSNAEADDPLVWYSGGATRWLHADHQGSIVAATNSSGGSPSINTYDEYGIPGIANDGRFQYTGQAWLGELGMYYYKARIYSPTLGRFLQTDPIGYDDQINLYAYVANDPVNNTDSTGEAIDVFVDVAFIIADVADIASNGLNATNGVSLGANIVGAVIPGATGLGAGTRALMRSGEGVAQGSKAAKGAAGGERAGKAFTPKGKAIIDSRNASKHGRPTCESCKQRVVLGQKSEKGVTPPKNERQRDHIIPKSKGGDGTPENGQVLCRDCNLKKKDDFQ